MLARSGLLIALLLLFVALALFAPNFLSSRNLLNVLRAVAFNGIIACGMTFMIISGDIDVSVGSAVAWASALLGVLTIQEGWPLGLAVIVVLVQGALIHAGAGYIRVKWAVPAFVVTLALFMSVARRSPSDHQRFSHHPVPETRSTSGAAATCLASSPCRWSSCWASFFCSTSSACARSMAARFTLSAATRSRRGCPASASGGPASPPSPCWASCLLSAASFCHPESCLARPTSPSAWSSK